MACNCPKANCPRHGNCEACLCFHAQSKHLPYCQKRRRGQAGWSVQCGYQDSRRRIMHGAVLLTVVLLIAALLAGAAVTRKIIEHRYRYIQEMTIRPLDPQQLNDGRYFGRFIYGSNRYDSEVVIEAGKIRSVNIMVETRDGNRKYVEQAAALLEDVKQNQTLAVDVISGATRSSKSILKSLENALAAGADGPRSRLAYSN